MNIDLIVKLARLANENPNENEANLAARKVCKLLKEGDYKLSNGSSSVKPNVGQPPPNRNQYYGENAYEHFYEDW